MNNNLEDIKSFVAEGYRNILRREPDTSGFENFVSAIYSKKISKETFLQILRTSEEYQINLNKNLGEQVKLNLGCGSDKKPYYKNIDIRQDVNPDIVLNLEDTPYPFGNDSIDEIIAFDILEHFSYWSIERILKEWYRILKSSGKLIIKTPDFDMITANAASGDIKGWHLLSHYIFGGHEYKENFHKAIFTKSELNALLLNIGFRISNMYNNKDYDNRNNITCEAVKV